MNTQDKRSYDVYIINKHQPNTNTIITNDEKPKIQISGIDKYKSLNRTYNNANECEKYLKEYTDKYFLRYKKQIHMRLDVKNLCIRFGHSKVTNIGKINLIY